MNRPEVIRLFDAEPPDDGERFDELLRGNAFRLERIVSLGHTTPEDDWYDQDRPEWVVLISGGARLAFDDGGPELALTPGDALLIPAACRHRVTWTDPNRPSVWLALHFSE